MYTRSAADLGVCGGEEGVGEGRGRGRGRGGIGEG